MSETAVFSNVDFKSLGQAKVEDRVVESTLEILSVETGERRIVYRAKRHFEAPNWSRDGSYLLFNGNGRLFTIPVAGGEPRAVGHGLRDSLQQRPRFLARRQVAGDQRSDRGRLADLRAPEQRGDAAIGHAPCAVLLARLVARWQDACLLRRPRGQLRHLHDPGRGRDRAAADRRSGSGRRARLLARRPDHLLQFRAVGPDEDLADEGRRLPAGASDNRSRTTPTGSRIHRPTASCWSSSRTTRASRAIRRTKTFRCGSWTCPTASRESWPGSSADKARSTCPPGRPTAGPWRSSAIAWLLRDGST